MTRGYHPDGTHARTQYSLEQVRDGLTRYALCGSYAQVARELKIGVGTIRAWRTESHTELWTRIRDEVEEQVGDRVAAVVTHSLDRLEDNNEAMKDAYKKGDTNKIKDLATAGRNLAVQAGLGVDKSRIIREKPSFIVQQRIDPAEIAAELARVNPELAMQLKVLVPDVEHEEIVDAQLEPPKPAVIKPKRKPRAKPKAKPKAKKKPAKVKPK